MTTSSSTPVVVVPPLVRLDLGCGTKKKDGYTGVDRIGFPGVDVVCNVGADRWPWNDDSVDEVHCSHMLEHLKPAERVHFANELYRVLKPGGKGTIAVPHWCSARAYGDLTHEWPPVSEAWVFHLSAAWRKESAPHEDWYTCDFEAAPGGYSTSPALVGRNQEYVMHAVNWYKEACADYVFTLTKPARKP